VLDQSGAEIVRVAASISGLVARSLAQTADGRLLAAGQINGMEAGMAMLDSDGHLVTSFGEAGIVHLMPPALAWSRASSVAWTDDGIVVIGEGEDQSTLAHDWIALVDADGKVATHKALGGYLLDVGLPSGSGSEGEVAPVGSSSRVTLASAGTASLRAAAFGASGLPDVAYRFDGLPAAPGAMQWDRTLAVASGDGGQLHAAGAVRSKHSVALAFAAWTASGGLDQSIGGNGLVAISSLTLAGGPAQLHVLDMAASAAGPVALVQTSEGARLVRLS
jgi:hypothetical protein